MSALERRLIFGWRTFAVIAAIVVYLLVFRPLLRGTFNAAVDELRFEETGR